MRVETKNITATSPGRVDEHTSTDIHLDPGEDASTMTEEQKDALLQRAFLPHGDRPDPPAAPAPLRTPQEQLEITEDMRNQYPAGAVPVMESPVMRVARGRLDGPPTQSPTESRVELTPVDGSSDRIPPARRVRATPTEG